MVGPAAKEAGPKLLPLLKDADIEKAAAAALALLQIGVEKKPAVELLGKALDKDLQSGKDHIRLGTLKAVESIGAAATPLEPLLTAIAKDETDDKRIRANASRIL